MLACSYLGLIAACHVLLQSLSQAIRLTVYLRSKRILANSLFKIIPIIRQITKLFCLVLSSKLYENSNYLSITKTSV